MDHGSKTRNEKNEERRQGEPQVKDRLHSTNRSFDDPSSDSRYIPYSCGHGWAVNQHRIGSPQAMGCIAAGNDAGGGISRNAR